MLLLHMQIWRYFNKICDKHTYINYAPYHVLNNNEFVFVIKERFSGKFTTQPYI